MSATSEAGGRPRYTSPDDDSGRWDDFAFRDGDIVVSTRSKHGTTWVQTILLLLIHQDPDLPAPLAELSPWLDHLVEPLDEVAARLERQQHRRVIKTHTPLDGVPHDPRVTYVVAARQPLDAAVSLYHQGDNLDREKLHRLVGAPLPTGPAPSLEAWLQRWVDEDADPFDDLDSLPGVLRHLTDAWLRRDDANVVLVHFDDLLTDLEGQMHRLADVLSIDVPPEVWPDLVEAAGLPAMRSRADRLAPNTSGVLKDNTAFFRRGSSGAGAEALDAATLVRYQQAAMALAPDDLLAWLHR